MRSNNEYVYETKMLISYSNFIDIYKRVKYLYNWSYSLWYDHIHTYFIEYGSLAQNRQKKK